MVRGDGTVGLPLLHAAQEYQSKGDDDKNLRSPAASEAWRIVIAEFAEEYGNLLTGVLGHSTLRRPNWGDACGTRGSAGNRTRRANRRQTHAPTRGALRGRAAWPSNRVGRVPAEVPGSAQEIRKRCGGSRFAGRPCDVRADAQTLEVILDSILQYARQASIRKSCRCGLWWPRPGCTADAALRRQFRYERSASAGREPFDLMLSREAARRWRTA